MSSSRQPPAVRGLPSRHHRREAGVTPGSVRRLFLVYAAVTLVPVVALGAILIVLLHSTGNSRGLAEARAKAELIGRTVVSPALDGEDLRTGLDPTEQATVQRSLRLAIQQGDVLRIRLRDLDGVVVLADDGSGGAGSDDEAVDAAHGETISTLTWLNADSNDVGPRGPRVAEIYQPLDAANTKTQIGVLELYVPYAPIAQDINADQERVTVILACGLLLLWLCLLGVSASVTRRLRRQVSMTSFLATHDALTSLPNRVEFGAQIDDACRSGQSDHFAVALIDLDRFKDVNDVLGHDNGDRLLIEVGNRLSAELGSGDVLARFGGDEFGVILTDVHGEAGAMNQLARLRKVISAPVVVDGVPLVVEASIGVALAPDDGITSKTLLRRSDLAMYIAKRHHLGVTRYRAEHDHYDASALTLVAELSAAIDRDELVLHYQPKGDLQIESVSEVEALVRWQHPRLGLLQPDAFIALAEQTEIIDDLTRWVVRTAASQLPSLDPMGTLAVAVNVSARSIVRPDFADEVLAILAETNTDPRRLVVEITETALVVDPAGAALTLSRLNAAGIRISIDDFGAGQTSLAYLATLPVSELKIDKSFVIPMLTDRRKAAIVRSVISLGHSLGFTVTAEGVETAEILDQLRHDRCDTVQGYLLARPAPQTELLKGLTSALSALHPAGATAHLASPVG